MGKNKLHHSNFDKKKKYVIMKTGEPQLPDRGAEVVSVDASLLEMIRQKIGPKAKLALTLAGVLTLSACEPPKEGKSGAFVDENPVTVPVLTASPSPTPTPTAEQEKEAKRRRGAFTDR